MAAILDLCMAAGHSVEVEGVCAFLTMESLDSLGHTADGSSLLHVLLSPVVGPLGLVVVSPGAELNASPVFLHSVSVEVDSSSVSDLSAHVSEVSSGVVVSSGHDSGVSGVNSNGVLGDLVVVDSFSESSEGVVSSNSGAVGVDASDVVGMSRLLVSSDSNSELVSESHHESVSVSGVVSGLEVLHGLVGSLGSEVHVLSNVLSSGGVSGLEGTLRVEEREIAEVGVLLGGAGGDGEGGNDGDFGEHYYCLIDSH